MTDESHREPRPLHREVESPRTATGLWLPFMALASAAMLTIVSSIAVMTRPPRAALMAPAEAAEPARAPSKADDTEALKREVDALIREQKALDAVMKGDVEEVRVPCNAAVYRGDIDGRPPPFEECVTYRRK